ncbi:NADH-quinone oxidoreductase subunit C, partial [Streptomyces sp. MBT56]|uniref:NADH-quinone oxidoreductase subunit C n=1 Tax=Streptomyces sp. MBT56 TaxID=1488387 RepID=UPI001F2BE3FE
MPAQARGAAPGHPQAPGEDRARIPRRAVRLRGHGRRPVDRGSAQRPRHPAGSGPASGFGTGRGGAAMSGRDQQAESAAGAGAYDRLPDAVSDVFGDGATAESAYDLLTVDVPAAGWLTALRTARDELGCTYFDWLSAVDEPGVGFRVCAHVAALGTGTVRRLMVRTTVPHDAAVLPSAIDVYAGAA